MCEWGSVVMDDAFLDGIDEYFEGLVKLNGNGPRNGPSPNGTSRDRTLTEIMGRLEGLSNTQKKEVLEFIRSLGRDTDHDDSGQTLKSESNES